MPIPGSDWKYSFHADCEFNQKSQLEEVLEKIATITARVKVYGVYKNGKI
jgi:prephenate dehydratase